MSLLWFIVALLVVLALLGAFTVSKLALLLIVVAVLLLAFSHVGRGRDPV
jgi:hypothetical protein